MGIKVLISSARKCREKQIIKEMLEANPNIELVYDCNDTPTDYNRDQTKQQDIDNHIRLRTDWFIFLCPFDFVGEATFHELEVAAEASKAKDELPMVSIFLSEDPEEALRLCNGHLATQGEAPLSYDKRHDKSRAEIDALLNPDPEHRHYIPDRYKADNLLQKVQDELERFVRHGLRMRSYETFCSDIRPTDIFFDSNRAKEENGFDDSYFLPMEHFRQMMLQGTSHMLICGSPASGKTRSVYEYLRFWGQDSNARNVFISVRGARNLASSRNSHRCISLRKLVEELKAYDQYLKLHGCRIESDERHFIVIDQVDSMLGDDLDTLKELFREASSPLRPCYQILLTTTLSGYERMEDTFMELQNVQAIRDEFQVRQALCKIDIETISEHDARKIWQDMTEKDQIRAEKPQGKVVGDFIPKLRGYNKRLLEEAQNFRSDFPTWKIPYRELRINTIGAFVRSVQIVKRMRRNQTVPLCLCLMYMEQMLWDRWKTEYTPENFQNQFSRDLIKFMKDYFIANNILQLDFGKESSHEEGLHKGRFSFLSTPTATHADWLVTEDFDFEAERSYDNEPMVTIVSPSITLSFVNDKMWEELEHTYQFDYKIITLSNGSRTASLHARTEAECAMDIWYQTFVSYAPWTTLLRILTRSPLIPLDKFQKRIFDCKGANNTRFVEDRYRGLIDSIRKMPEAERQVFLDDSERKFLECLLTANKGNVDDIRSEVYDNGLTIKPQYINYSFVGELYKKAYERAQTYGYRKPVDAKMMRQLQEQHLDRNCCIDEYIQLADEVLNVLQERSAQTGRTAKAIERSDELFFYSRKILLCYNYQEAYDTFFLHTDLAETMREIGILHDNRSGEDEQATFADKACCQILSALSNLILGDTDFMNWLNLAEQTHTSITFQQMMQIVLNSNSDAKHSNLQRHLFKAIIQSSDQALRQGGNTALKEIMHTKGVVIISKMIELSPTLQAAREISRLAEAWLTDKLILHSPDTIDRWENLALCRTQPYEYPFLLKEITENVLTGEIKDRWAENKTLRNTLLCCPSNFSDSIELYCRLYENTEKAKRREPNLYTVANLYKKVSLKYKDVKKESINPSFEAFMQMMTYKKMYDCVRQVISNHEICNHNFFLDVYNSIVTKQQEQYFIQFIGNNAWNQLCQLSKINYLRICKERIYSIEEVITIIAQMVEMQKHYAIIEDDLINNAVNRLIHTPKGEEYDRLFDYLHSLLCEDKTYMEALLKSEAFYRSCHTLKVPVEYTHSFHPQEDKRKAGRGSWSEPQQLLLGRKINNELQNLTRQPFISRDYALTQLPMLRQDLEKLKGTHIIPNIQYLLYTLKNIVIEEDGKRGKSLRNLQPGNLIEIVRLCYTSRQLPVTTTIINALLEGIANYYHVSKKPQEKAYVEKTFWDFIHNEAPYVRLDALSYKFILTVWQEKAELHQERIRQLATCNEQLMNTLTKRHLLPTLEDWQVMWQEHIKIVGQKETKVASS